MNRGKVTNEMRDKWRMQWEYITCNQCIYEKLDEWEEKFIINIGEKYIKKNKDLTFGQSINLNKIFNKYQ